MKVSEIFLAVADKLAPEGAWTRKVLARDKYGESVSPDIPEACCWCISGAISSIATSQRELHEVFVFWACNYNENIIQFNDLTARDQDEVVTMVRKMAYNAKLVGL